MIIENWRFRFLVCLSVLSNSVADLEDNFIISNNKRGLPSYGSHVFSESEEAAIVDKHNEFRKTTSPPAANMGYMIWNSTLETLADTQVKTCRFEHKTGLGSLGESIWIGPNGDNIPPGYNAVVAWHNEEQYYTYDGHTCTSGKVCGHYLQVVYAKTLQVGCSRVFCETLIKPKADGTEIEIPNYWLINCHYSLGPYSGVLPFVEAADDASRCTECPIETRQCDGGLCRDCVTDGVKGCDCKLNKCAVGHRDDATCECTCCSEPLKSYGNTCSSDCLDKNICYNPKYVSSRYCGLSKFKRDCPSRCEQCNLWKCPK